MRSGLKTFSIMLVNYNVIATTVEGILRKKSVLIKYGSALRQFKTLPKFNTAQKMYEKFKREREMKIYKGRILTVPNILTISRITVSPFFPWLIANGHLKSSFALLVYCGATDIVQSKY